MTTSLLDDYAASDTPSWRDGVLDLEVRAADVLGTRVRYVDTGAGDGPPLVLLHGIGGCWQNWIQNIPRLALERRVIAIDFPGFGASPVPREGVTMTFYARVVDALCESLGLARVVVIGNSMGGLVATRAAARFPERVSGLVLISPAGASLGRLSEAAGVAVRLAALQSTALHRTVQRVAPSDEHPITYVLPHPRKFERGLLKQAFAPGAGAWGFPLALADLMQRRVRGRLLPQPGRVVCPALVIWGREDRILPLDDARVFAERIAAAQVVVLDGTGHVAMLERPREVNQMILEFIR